MKDILKKTWAVIKYNMGSLVLFEIGYRIAVFFLMMQLVHGAVNFSLKQQNFSYLTAENYGQFVRQPTVYFFAFWDFNFTSFLFLD